jgi:hypothetical protein
VANFHAFLQRRHVRNALVELNYNAIGSAKTQIVQDLSSAISSRFALLPPIVRKLVSNGRFPLLICIFGALFVTISWAVRRYGDEAVKDSRAV